LVLLKNFALLYRRVVARAGAASKFLPEPEPHKMIRLRNTVITWPLGILLVYMLIARAKSFLDSFFYTVQTAITKSCETVFFVLLT
jgi:hypothetical protein